MKILFLLLMTLNLFGHPIPLPKGIYNYDEEYKDHPGDYPFPTEMSFSNLCDHKITFLIDSFDPDLVKEGDTIFLLDWYLPWFVEKIHPQISHKYILVSNDTDGTHPDKGVLKLLYDPKVAAWFCKNFIFDRHPKLFQIPIGQNIMYWHSFHEDHEKAYLRKLVTQPNTDKEHLIFLNITVRKDGHRDLIYRHFKEKPFVHFRETPLDRLIYWDELSRSKFVFSPPGIGLDTVRFWEAIVLNCIPVIVHSPLDFLYRGTPCLFVDRWEDINEEFLNRKYIEIQKKIAAGEMRKEKGFIDYWAPMIHEVQEQVRSHKWDGNKLEKTKIRQSSIEKLNEILSKNIRTKRMDLFISGRLLGLRALQIAKEMPYVERIFFHDPYSFDSRIEHFNFLSKIAQDRSIFSHAKRLQPVSFDGILNAMKKLNSSKRNDAALFFDLSHYRFDFIKDLDKLWRALPLKTLILGNMIVDEYVRDELNKFTSSKGVKLNSKEPFWYLFKK
jgi:hypothetical protein